MTTTRRALATAVALLAIVAGLAITSATPAQATPGLTFERLSGWKRWNTAADIARSAFPDGATRAVLASGIQFPDALAATYYAGAIDAPVLLATDYIVPDAVMAALSDLGVEHVTLVGGSAVLGPIVEGQLTDAGYTIDRIAGADRYDTAERLAREPGADAVGTIDGGRTAIVATGAGFADALVAGPIAYAEHVPILLTPPTELGADARAALTELDIDHVLVVGGTGAVSQGVQTTIEGLGITTERLAGSDRYATAKALADYAWDRLGFSREHVNLATGNGFPDAIAGGPHGGVELAPILLAGPAVPPATSAALTARSSTLSSGHAFGGVGVIPADVLAALSACGGSSPTNQAFDVHHPSQASLLTDQDRTFTVTGLGATPEVDVALLDCADISIAGTVVTFVAADGVAVGVGTADAASITAVNDTDQDPLDAVSAVAPVDGEVTVTVTGEADGCAALVAFADTDGDDALAVGDDGRPTEAFGAGGLTAVHEIAGLAVTPEGALRRLGGSHAVEAQVTDADGRPVPAVGVPVLVTVEALDGPGFDDEGCATIDPTVGRTEVIAARTTTNLAGLATFTYDGPADPTAGDDDPVLHCITVVLDLDDDGESSDGDLTGEAGASFDDAASEPTTLDLIAPGPTGLVRTRTTFTATLADQYDEPLANRVVTFEIFRDDGGAPLVSTTRTTDAAGRAELVRRGPDSGADDVVVACLENPDDASENDVSADNARCDIVEDDDTGDDVADTPGAEVAFSWVQAPSTPTETAHDSCVLAADAVNDSVDVEDVDDGANRRFRHDAGDTFQVVTVTGPVAAIDPVLQSRFEAMASAGDRVHVDYVPSGATTYTLYDDDNCIQDITAGEASTDGAFG